VAATGETAGSRRGPAIGEVYDRDRDALARMAAFVTGDVEAAVDLVQDAFADLQQSWNTVEDPQAWLRSAVAKRSVSWVRRRIVARKYLHTYGQSTDEVRSVDSAGRLVVRDAVAELTPDRRVVVFCRFYLDLSEAQTAAMLGIPVGTVKSRLSRALHELEGALS